MSRDDQVNSYPGKGFEPAPTNFGWVPLNVPMALNFETTKLVKDFAESLAAKLLKAQEKYGYTDNWRDPAWMDKCRADLKEHLEKGDPRDVAAYCAFLWYHNEPTSNLDSKRKESDELFESIQHGDDGHKAWLKEAIFAHNTGAEMPAVIESKTKLKGFKMKFTKKSATTLFSVLAIITVLVAVALFVKGTLGIFSGGSLIVALIACYIGIQESKKMPEDTGVAVPGAIGGSGNSNDTTKTNKK